MQDLQMIDKDDRREVSETLMLTKVVENKGGSKQR
jgi:hypothetical protein